MKRLIKNITICALLLSILCPCAFCRPIPEELKKQLLKKDDRSRMLRASNDALKNGEDTQKYNEDLKRMLQRSNEAEIEYVKSLKSIRDQIEAFIEILEYKSEKVNDFFRNEFKKAQRNNFKEVRLLTSLKQLVLYINGYTFCTWQF